MYSAYRTTFKQCNAKLSVSCSFSSTLPLPAASTQLQFPTTALMAKSDSFGLLVVHIRTGALVFLGKNDSSFHFNLHEKVSRKKKNLTNKDILLCQRKILQLYSVSRKSLRKSFSIYLCYFILFHQRIFF